MTAFSKTKFAAWLQNLISQRREETGLYREIAEALPLDQHSRVLDVGTGSGLQLKVIHEVEPTAELYGIDLSLEAINIAEKNLRAMEVDLRVESIEDTSFENNFFDTVTCNASMSYWEDLLAGFDEVYRILKPGGSAVLFEPRRNIDIEHALDIVRQNLAQESGLRRFVAVNFNRFALRRGSSVGLNLYEMSEVEAVAHKSRFEDRVCVTEANLQGIPIFMKITLAKPIG